MPKQFLFKEGSASVIWEIVFIIVMGIAIVLCGYALNLSFKSKPVAYAGGAILIATFIGFHKFLKYLNGRKTYFEVSNTGLALYKRGKMRWRLPLEEIVAMEDKQGKVILDGVHGFIGGGAYGFYILTSTHGYYTILGSLTDYDGFLNELKSFKTDLVIADLNERRRVEAKTKDLKITPLKFLFIILWPVVIGILIYLFSVIKDRFGN